jgi:hypothetical protein
MKTKMKTIEEYIPPALREVWAMKDAVSEDIKDMTVKERIAYFQKGVKLAAKRMGARIVREPDGTCRLV